MIPKRKSPPNIDYHKPSDLGNLRLQYCYGKTSRVKSLSYNVLKLPFYLLKPQTFNSFFYDQL